MSAGKSVSIGSALVHSLKLAFAPVVMQPGFLSMLAEDMPFSAPKTKKGPAIAGPS